MKLVVAGEIVATLIEVVSESIVIISTEITLSNSTIVTFEGYNFNQLMTGIDFGGVQIQGTTFDVTGGWDALPWFTDNWDSVEASSDYYYVVDAIGDGSTTAVTLPYIPAPGQEINIYIKRKVTTVVGGLLTGDNYAVVREPTIEASKIIRIDDPNYSDAWDSSVAANPNAQMPTFVGDGVTSTIEIGQYIQTFSGDILIFRPVESDGSVTITDENLLDTQISGGTLTTIDQIYATATGTFADEIAINGGKFIEPDHIPAPEENIPGQVLDSLSIKVFQNTVSGSVTLQSKISEAINNNKIFAIGQRVVENTSVFVYVDKTKQIFNDDYSLDLVNFNVEFITAPNTGSIIEIISIGIGGLEILDYKEFIADGETNLFLTDANYDNTSSIFVTVNGNQIITGFKNSTEIVDAVGRTLVEFGFNPAAGDIIKIICIRNASNSAIDALPIIRVNTQTVYFEGSTRSFALDNFVELTRGSASSSMIVEINDRVLQGVDTTFATYDGSNNTFVLGLDPLLSAGSLLANNVKVYINNVLKEFITDYVFDAPTKLLTIYPSELTVGDEIKVENDFDAEYTINNNNLIINDSVNMPTTDETNNAEIKITWFSEYASMNIVSDEKTGGKVQYQLSRPPISVSYVWVYKNGQRLTQDIDYYVSLPRSVVYLNVDSSKTDKIKIITFTDNIFKLPSAFEIHKDMLNVYHYNRFSKGEVILTSPLKYYDVTISVNNASLLSDPIPNRNIPGIIHIDGERIEYMSKVGNVLGQLRRGVQGTAIKELYEENTLVADVGYQDTIPYNETQERIDFIFDGSTLLIGPLEFVPSVSAKSRWYSNNLYVNKGEYNNLSSYVPRNVVLYNGNYYANIRPSKGALPTSAFYWTAITIPSEYGPSDSIEVFAAGRRLRKDPYTVWFEDNGPYSPTADVTVEAEFSVDGKNYGSLEKPVGYIRLTDPLKVGTRITIIRKTGKTWYTLGDNTASNGVSLTESTTSIAKFIAQKTTSLPE
jgi:hypothetical protein